MFQLRRIYRGILTRVSLDQVSPGTQRQARFVPAGRPNPFNTIIRGQVGDMPNMTDDTPGHTPSSLFVLFNKDVRGASCNDTAGGDCQITRLLIPPVLP